MTRLDHLRKFLHFLLVGPPLCAPVYTMRAGPTIEIWSFSFSLPCHLRATSIFLSFVLARAKI